MMEKTRILFVSQEITPYLPESPMGKIGRFLPQGIQEKNKEIRTFMPRFGCINERRNQLHEVIRLSGMNLIIDDTDHPLLIKVASIQSARMQIYFIDNEDYFQRKFIFRDKNEKFYKDNDERAIFYSRGVLETVKKLGWAPDVVHCHGWITSLVPLYVKKVFKDNPVYANTKVICSIYDDDFSETLNKKITEKAKLENINDEDMKHLVEKPDYVNLYKTAIDYSDGIIVGSPVVNDEILDYSRKSGVPFLEYQDGDNYIDVYSDFYDKIISAESIKA